MTREEAIENLKWLLECSYVDSFEDAENEALEMAIKTLEQEPCSDAISRQAVNDAINDVLVKYIPILYGSCEKIPLEVARAIMQLPPANPQPKTGHWYSDCRNDYFICNQCKAEFERFSQGGYELIDDYNFCPNCGARMESET